MVNFIHYSMKRSVQGTPVSSPVSVFIPLKRFNSATNDWKYYSMHLLPPPTTLVGYGRLPYRRWLPPGNILFSLQVKNYCCFTLETSRVCYDSREFANTNINVKFLFKTSHAALIWKRNFTCVFMFLFLFVIRKLPIVTDRSLPSHVLYQYQINSQFHVTQSWIEFRFSGWKTSTLVNTP